MEIVMNRKKRMQLIFTMVITLLGSVAVQGTASQAAGRSYTDKDMKYMAAIIYCEAGNQSYAGKMGVGCVVMNRVKSSRFPNTVLKVIRQPGQFGPVRQGKFQREVARVESGKYSSGARRLCLKAAQEVLEGQTNVKYKGKTLNMRKYYYFNGRLSGAKLRIGGHQFK